MMHCVCELWILAENAGILDQEPCHVLFDETGLPSYLVFGRTVPPINFFHNIKLSIEFIVKDESIGFLPSSALF